MTVWMGLGMGYLIIKTNQVVNYANYQATTAGSRFHLEGFLTFPVCMSRFVMLNILCETANAVNRRFHQQA